LMHDALVERTGVGYEPYTPEQQAGITQMLEKYIEANEADEEDILNINSFRQMLEICKQFKNMILACRSEVTAVREEVLTQLNSNFSENGRPVTSGLFGTVGHDFHADAKLMDEFDPRGANFVGEESKSLGFAVGIAANDSRPNAGVEGIRRYAEGKGNSESGAASNNFDKKTDFFAAIANRSDLDFVAEKAMSDTNSLLENEKFLSFTRLDGSEYFREFADAKSTSKEIRNKIKDFGMIVNDSKIVIDKLQDEIEVRKASRIEMLRKSGLKPSATEDIIDEEEFKLMKDLKEAKRRYKNSYEQLQKLKSSFSQTKELMNSRKALMLKAFINWNTGGDTRSFGELGDPMKRFADPSDALDDQEAFDRLEIQRVLDNDPDSLAFFQAQKTKRAHITQNGTNLKLAQKNKRMT